MAYRYTAGQKKYLRRMHAAKADLERGCDCPGGDGCPNTEHPCKGFVRNCKCDQNRLSYYTDREKGQ